MSKIGLLLALLLGSAGAQAGVIDIGAAMGGANVYTLGDFRSSHSDVEGAIVSGGNVTIQSYSVNLNNKKAYGDYAVVAAGDIKLNSGTIHHGKTYAGGTTTLAQAPSTVQDTTAPLDFAATNGYFKALSSSLAQLQGTGSVESLWSGTKLIGSGQGGIDVFNVSADVLRVGSYWMLEGLTPGQTLIFNVSGSEATFNPNGINFSPLSGFNVLFNFYEAELLNVKNVIGSVLAPYATVNGPEGVINGNVVVDRWDSPIQINSNHYFQAVDLPGFQLISGGTGPVPDPVPADPADPVTVPLPGTLALLLAGVAGMAVQRRRR